MQIRLAGINPQSLVNGPGLRKVYFSQGCRHHCDQCFNPETWSFTGGKLIEIDSLVADLKKEKNYLSGVTFSGGDPIEQADKFKILAKECKKMDLNVWVWTGYTWEQLLEKISHGENDIKELFENIDVLVDGKFIVSERISEEVHPYRGSNNQRLIDVKKSLAEHSIHLFNIT